MSFENLDNIIKHTPEFLAHKRERQAERNALIQSGVMSTSPELDNLARSAARTLIMPFNKPLGGDDDVMKVGTQISVSGVSSGKDIATQNLRAKGFGAHDLESMISGDDKMGYVSNHLADYWNKRMNIYVANMLVGVFASSSMASNTHDSELDAGYEAILDGVNVLGDRAGEVGVLVVNSKTALKLQKEQFNQFVPSNQTNTGLASYMNGRFQVIVDDIVADDTIYALGSGALSFGNGTDTLEAQGTVPIELDRQAGLSKSTFYSREKFIVHVNGVSWVGQATDEYPTNDEIAVGTNWNRVYDPKNIAAVKINLNVVE